MYWLLSKRWMHPPHTHIYDERLLVIGFQLPAVRATNFSLHLYFFASAWQLKDTCVLYLSKKVFAGFFYATKALNLPPRWIYEQHKSPHDSICARRKKKSRRLRIWISRRKWGDFFTHFWLRLATTSSPKKRSTYLEREEWKRRICCKYYIIYVTWSECKHSQAKFILLLAKWQPLRLSFRRGCDF